MVKQGQQDEQNDQVSASVFLSFSKTIDTISKLEYTYPKWLHHQSTHPTSASSGENPPNITTAQAAIPAHQTNDELGEQTPATHHGDSGPFVFPN